MFHVDIRVKPADGPECEEGSAGVVKIGLTSRIDQEQANIERITNDLSKLKYAKKYQLS